MSKFKKVSAVVFALLFAAAGANHFINTPFYMSIMPPYVPWHYAMVVISGVAEVVFGIGLLFAGTRQISAWALIALLIAVFPANIHMALNPELYPTIAPIALWLRLPLQGAFILWAYWYTRDENRRRAYLTS